MHIGEYPTAPSASEDELGSTVDERLVLLELGFSKLTVDSATAKAGENGTTIESELLHSGAVDETSYYGAMARFLRLPFIAQIDPSLVTDMLTLDTQLVRPNQIRINHRNRAPQVAIAPEAARLGDLKAALAAMPALGQGLAVTTPSAIRSTVWRSGETRRVRNAVNQLFENMPAFSARVVVTGKQGFIAGVILMGILASLIWLSTQTLLLLHIFLSLTYFISLLFRIAALRYRSRASAKRKALNHTSEPLPVYTVMVALYREAAVAGQLVKSLQRLDWPSTLLDIKLVCEADDQETIAALKAENLGPHFEIVEVPACSPRTKPKALTYALNGARGEFLAIYDAEDRPHPEQLREAYQGFRASSDRLACLQAPLVITNAKDSWISTLFSLEYSALFRGMLPMLAQARMPLPLGGTSNHFRTSILRAAGGWDPFNVTEDADLGLRFHRLGYRSDVISRQTLEDAPTSMRIWSGQRSRWFKGWLQTWLVLMRNPQHLIREMGAPAFFVFQLTVGGMLVSSLLHPLIIAFLGIGFYTVVFAPPTEISAATLTLLIMDSVNIVASYLIFLGLGIGSMTSHEKMLIGRRWAAVPIYWLMTSHAAWRAALELRSKPFFWNKTPHKPIQKD